MKNQAEIIKNVAFGIADQSRRNKIQTILNHEDKSLIDKEYLIHLAGLDENQLNFRLVQIINKLIDQTL